MLSVWDYHDQCVVLWSRRRNVSEMEMILCKKLPKIVRYRRILEG